MGCRLTLGERLRELLQEFSFRTHNCDGLRGFTSRLRSEKRLIIQYESLLKLREARGDSFDLKVDLLILDEARSILSNATCTKTNGENLRKNWMTFLRLCETATHVLAADADAAVDDALPVFLKSLKFNLTTPIAPIQVERYVRRRLVAIQPRHPVRETVCSSSDVALRSDSLGRPKAAPAPLYREEYPLELHLIFSGWKRTSDRASGVEMFQYGVRRALHEIRKDSTAKCEQEDCAASVGRDDDCRVVICCRSRAAADAWYSRVVHEWKSFDAEQVKLWTGGTCLQTIRYDFKDVNASIRNVIRIVIVTSKVAQGVDVTFRSDASFLM